MQENEKVIIWVETQTELGKAELFAINEETRTKLYEFLSKQPYEQISEIIPLVKTSNALSQLEISRLVSFMAQYPIYIGIALFNELVENIVPIVEDENPAVE